MPKFYNKRTGLTWDIHESDTYMLEQLAANFRDFERVEDEDKKPASEPAKPKDKKAE